MSKKKINQKIEIDSQDILARIKKKDEDLDLMANTLANDRARYNGEIEAFEKKKREFDKSVSSHASEIAEARKLKIELEEKLKKHSEMIGALR